MDEDSDSLLLALIGWELGSVVFVRDYLQLVFDEPRLSLYMWPRTEVNGRVRTLGDPGYRDALCTLIGHPVIRTAESADAGLFLDFGIGSVTVKPEPTELVGPEIAMLNGFVDRQDWMVWRPGEPPFDGPEWD